MSKDRELLRVRFHQPTDDYRPIPWPIPHPYWVSGQRCHDDAWTIVAYVDSVDQLREQWPEAIDIEEPEPCSDYTFTSRFPRPDWLQDATAAKGEPTK